MKFHDSECWSVKNTPIYVHKKLEKFGTTHPFLISNVSSNILVSSIVVQMKPFPPDMPCTFVNSKVRCLKAVHRFSLETFDGFIRNSLVKKPCIHRLFNPYSRLQFLITSIQRLAFQYCHSITIPKFVLPSFKPFFRLYSLVDSKLG